MTTGCPEWWDHHIGTDSYSLNNQEAEIGPEPDEPFKSCPQLIHSGKKHPDVLVTEVLGLAQSIRLTLNINYRHKQQTKTLTELSVTKIRKVIVMLSSQNTNAQTIKSARNQYKGKIQKVNVEHTKKRFKEQDIRVMKDAQLH